jgi:hypothetical protein
LDYTKKKGGEFMVAGQQLYRNQAISFFPGQEDLIAIDEQFVQLTDFCIPGLYDYYLVSNYGRIFNKYSNSFLSIQIGTDGYYQVNLSGSFGSKLMRINRLVMMGFNPIINSDNFVVNHLDGNPKNNYIGNLEWATRSRNTKHAYDIGLMNKGENGSTAIISNETTAKICQLLETNMTFEEIVKNVGNGATINIVQNILHGTSWVDISKNYTFRKMRKRYLFNDKELDQICKYFETHPKPINISMSEYFREMLKQYNYFDKDADIETILATCRKIYNRKSYNYLSAKYNF